MKNASNRQRVTSERLEKVFSILGKAGARASEHCKGMEGLIKETSDLVGGSRWGSQGRRPDWRTPKKSNTTKSPATARCARWPGSSTCRRAADILQETLDEEKSADEKLTRIATSSVNAHAQKR